MTRSTALLLVWMQVGALVSFAADIRGLNEDTKIKIRNKWLVRRFRLTPGVDLGRFVFA